MSSVWFTSDTHAYHKNICRGSSQWEKSRGGQRLRDFDDQYKMTEQLIQNINKVVLPDDVLYHLGDWSFGGIDKIWDFRRRIYCKTIHLIYGNHDEHLEKNKQVTILAEDEALFESVAGFNISASRKFDGKRTVEVQDFFASCEYYNEVSYAGKRIILSHFAHRVWNKMHHGSLHLYGHSHGTLKDGYGKSMDVGVDTHPDFRPYKLEEILKTLEKRDVLIVDHHNSETT